MKRKSLYLLLSFLILSYFTGCSDSVLTITGLEIKEFKVQTTSIETDDVLEFYVWHRVPFGENPAIQGAYIEIFQGENSLFYSGTTNVSGKINIPLSVLRTGNLRVYAYTFVNGNLDYYGYRDFFFENQFQQISVEVNHS